MSDKTLSLSPRSRLSRRRKMHSGSLSLIVGTSRVGSYEE